MVKNSNKKRNGTIMASACQDPALARFFAIDRFAEDYYSISPYQYAANNPINNIDVNGDWIYVMHEGQSYKYDNGNLYAYNKSLILVKRKTIIGAAQIKEELYHYIEEADARLLKMRYAVAKEYTQEDYTLPGEPMSKETLKSRIRAAKSRIDDGRFTTREELEKETKGW